MSDTPENGTHERDGDLSIRSEDDPFEELTGGDSDEPGIDIEAAFEEMDVPEIDEEEIWDAVFSEEDRSKSGIHPDLAGQDSTTEGADAVVEKDRYCLRCEFFSEPPDVACTRSDTEIVELIGVDTFRLRNCPVVANRRRAETVVPDE